MADSSSKRERKQTTFFKAPEVSEPKELIIPNGSGISMAENPVFCKELDKRRAEDDMLKAMHSLCFGAYGKKAEIKKNLRKFSGFDPSVAENNKLSVVIDKKQVWTVATLKNALMACGQERSGDRETLAKRLVDYLQAPTAPKASAVKEGKKPKVKKAATKGKKRKLKGKKDGEPKKKRAPTAFLIFSMATRATVKEENPDAPFTELSKILGAKWNALSEEEKSPWLEKAAKAKADLNEGNADENVDVDDDDEEEDAEGEKADEEDDYDDEFDDVFSK